jgi:hypothetical protein
MMYRDDFPWMSVPLPRLTSPMWSFLTGAWPTCGRETRGKDATAVLNISDWGGHHHYGQPRPLTTGRTGMSCSPTSGTCGTIPRRT